MTFTTTTTYADESKKVKIRKKFRKYVQVHDQHDNLLLLQTIGAIGLCAHYSLSLHPGRHIPCNSWTIRPMPREVLLTVHQLVNVCKKYKGIVLIYKELKTIDYSNNDQNNS